MAQDPKNTFLKVTDGNLDITQVLVAASMPVKEDMPDLEDRSFKEPMGEEP